MTTPDQPTGMNELREILEQYGRSVASGDYSKASVDQTEAVIQQLVERCLPAKIGHKGWCDLLSTSSYINKEDVSCSCDSPAQHQAIDQFRHNLQQAGLLRGDET